jgi:hypothetical protein
MNAVRFLFLSVASFLLALMPASCSLPAGSPYGAMGSHEVLLILPPLPPGWAFLPDFRMALTWRGLDGRLRSALALPGTSLRIEVERGLPQSILALPSSAGRGLMPAGALYPEALAASAGDELVLDWKGGYAASVALALLGGGVDPWGYDLSKLADEALARCGDPWLIPAHETARRLADLDFRIDPFKEPLYRKVSLPGSGPWAPESPFAAVPTASTAGDSVASLSEGLWRFLSPGEELLVSMDAEGRATFIRR